MADRNEYVASRTVQECPTCGRRRRMFCKHYEWYGWHVTCLGCGDQWQDGEMLERPFRPRWREENKAKGRAAWSAVGHTAEQDVG